LRLNQRCYGSSSDLSQSLQRVCPNFPSDGLHSAPHFIFSNVSNLSGRKNSKPFLPPILERPDRSRVPLRQEGYHVHNLDLVSFNLPPFSHSVPRKLRRRKDGAGYRPVYRVKYPINRTIWRGVITTQYPKITLAAARVNANLTQVEAADLLGISKETLQNYESGKTVPTVFLCRKIEEVYRFPIAHIRFGAEGALSGT